MSLTSDLSGADDGSIVTIDLALGQDTGSGSTNTRVKIKATSGDLDLSSPGNVTSTPSGALQNVNETNGVVTVIWSSKPISTTPTNFQVTVKCKPNAQGSTQVDSEGRELGGTDVVTDSITIPH